MQNTYMCATGTFALIVHTLWTYIRFNLNDFENRMNNKSTRLYNIFLYKHSCQLFYHRHTSILVYFNPVTQVYRVKLCNHLGIHVLNHLWKRMWLYNHLGIYVFNHLKMYMWIYNDLEIYALNQLGIYVFSHLKMYMWIYNHLGIYVWNHLETYVSW